MGAERRRRRDENEVTLLCDQRCEVPEAAIERVAIGRVIPFVGTAGRDEIWERHFRAKPERDRLLLALMAYAGLRRGELLGLDWDDVDLSRRLLRVRKAKGGRQRTIPIRL